MGRVKRRMLAYLLTMAMVLSLCTGITARAAGDSRKLLVGREEGWDQEKNLPIAPTSLDVVGEEEHISVMADERLFFGFKNGDQLEPITKEERNALTIKEVVNEQEVDAGDKASISPFYTWDDAQKKDVETDIGFVSIRINEIGEYRVYYGNSYVTIIAEMPEAAMYSSVDCTIDDIISSGDKDIYYPYDNKSYYYLGFNVPGATALDIDDVACAIWNSKGEQEEIDTPFFVYPVEGAKWKWSFKLPEGKSLNYTDFETEITYRCTIEEQGGKHEETRDARFHFRLSKDGFVIGGVEWKEGAELPEFGRDEWFNKEQTGEIPGDTQISLGMSDGNEITPIKDKDINNITITDDKGNPTDEVTIDKKNHDGDDAKTLPEGVYRIVAPKKIADYYINYKDGEKTYSVKYSTTLPRIGIYNYPARGVDNLISRLNDDVEYTPGQKIYLIANDEFKADDNVESVSVKTYNSAFSLPDGEYSWDAYKDSSMDAFGLEVSKDAIGRIDPAAEVLIKYKDRVQPEIQTIRLEEKREGWMIADTEWKDDKPVPREDIYAYSSLMTTEVYADQFVSVANLDKGTATLLKHSDVISFGLYDAAGENKVSEEVGNLSDEYWDGKCPDGVFRLKINKLGTYTIIIIYRDAEDSAYSCSFKVKTRLPQLALYSEDTEPAEENIIATRNMDGEIDGRQINTYYLMHSWSEDELKDINSIEIETFDGRTEVTKTTFNKDDIAALKTSRMLTDVTFNYTNDWVDFNVKVHRNNMDKPDEFGFSLKPKSVGLVISHDADGAFNEDKSDYYKNWDISSNVFTGVSIGTIADDKLAPVPAEDKDVFVLKDMDGNTVENWFIYNAKDKSEEDVDGVFIIVIPNTGAYNLFYKEECVTLFVDYPAVAYVSEEGVTYCHEDEEAAAKILDDPYQDELSDGDGKQLFEKSFYIGSYTQPETIGGEDRKTVTINKIIPMKGEAVIDEPIEGIEYEISKDGHTAVINANMNAIAAIESSKISFKVQYTVQFYYKEGEKWKPGRYHDDERLFEIDLGSDDRIEIDPDDIEWPENCDIEYDGTEKAIELEDVPEYVDVTYEDNKKTSIGDYTANATLTIKKTDDKDYRTAYKFKGDDPGVVEKEVDWKIVKPQSVTAIEAAIDNSLGDPDSITTADEDVVNSIKKDYDSLSEAVKGVVEKELVDKLNKAVTSLNNFKDAVAKLDALPEAEEVTLSDEAAINAARAAYDKLTAAQKAALDDEAVDNFTEAEKVLAKKKADKKAAEDKKAADDVVSKISKLPNMAGVSDEEAVKAARAAYEALTADQKKLVDASILKKLTNAEESVAKAKKQAEEDAKKPKYSEEWVDGKWYNADGTQTYPGTLQWKNNATGWWVEDTDGWYPTDKWQKIDGVWYYFKPDGYMAANEYYKGYWFNADGSWDDKYFLSWKSNATGWWVEDISGWWPSSSWLKIDGYWYYFDASGYMVTSQYVDGYWISADGVCY